MNYKLWFAAANMATALPIAACQMDGLDGAATETSESRTDATELQRANLVEDERCGWAQWGQNATHDGRACGVGQAPSTVLDHLVYDPFEFQEIDTGSGDLFIHYQVPLTDNAGNFFMLQKGGTYTTCDSPEAANGAPCGFDQANIVQETWSEKKFHRNGNGTFVEKWSFASDWKPFPVIIWEPMFQPAIAGPLLYVPGAGGTVWQVLTILDHPVALQRINPFDTVDPNTYVTSGVTIDRFGFAYWNVLQQDPNTFEDHGFLIKAAPWGQTWKVDYATLIPGAPADRDSCFLSFYRGFPPLPWPPAADAVPQLGQCGQQRPGVNVTPAIGRDGTIFTASTADFNSNYSYIVALKPDLELKWATSLRGLVNDGCGVPHPGNPEGDVFCSDTFSAVGVDPDTNMPPALHVDDFSSSTPVALPDGGVLYGALDNYNFARGHLVKLDRDGKFLGTYSFGWDSTPAVHEHDGTYSIVIKDNHYESGGPFFITQLSADLEPEWQFQNTSTQACTRQPDARCSAPTRYPTASSSRTASNGASTHPPSTPKATSTPMPRMASSIRSAPTAS